MAEYIVNWPIDIEAITADGKTLKPPQEILERIVRCLNCVFFDGEGCNLLNFAHSDMARGFCAWGKESSE